MEDKQAPYCLPLSVRDPVCLDYRVPIVYLWLSSYQFILLYTAQVEKPMQLAGKGQSDTLSLWGSSELTAVILHTHCMTELANQQGASPIAEL